MLNLPTHPDRPARRNMIDDQFDDAQSHTIYDPEHEVYDGDGVEQEKKTMMIDLMAIAKPAKVKGAASSVTRQGSSPEILSSRKGVAREFEVVKRVKDVIVLEDQDTDVDFDEWETINYAEGNTEKRTYSAALRGR